MVSPGKLEEIMRTSRTFVSEDVGRFYMAVACVNIWQKETGGTLDELLVDIERSYVKKSDLEEGK